MKHSAMTGTIQPMVRRVASISNTMNTTPTKTSRRFGTVARSVKSSPPDSA
ncbi:MAG: hypothetical protein M5U07_24255 [Xanthobacteraceae bacterium]|nr:hypothetical protein [Xanthobacteraceae bacterium]